MWTFACEQLVFNQLRTVWSRQYVLHKPILTTKVKPIIDAQEVKRKQSRHIATKTQQITKKVRAKKEQGKHKTGSD